MLFVFQCYLQKLLVSIQQSAVRTIQKLLCLEKSFCFWINDLSCWHIGGSYENVYHTNKTAFEEIQP